MNKETCLKLVKQTIDNFNVKFPRFSIEYPEVGFFSQGSAAGFAMIHSNRIEFNTAIMVEQEEDSFIQTIIHEIAHKIVNRHYPHAKQHHGREWKYFMHIMGAEVRRCHSYDTSNCNKKKMNYFLYSCTCGEDHAVSATTHNRMQSSSQYRLRCVKSGNVLSKMNFSGKKIVK